MAWVIWDDVKGFDGMARSLPPQLQGRDQATLNLLGYRELVVRQPEDFIPRFRSLLGSGRFDLLDDGRVEQTFPDADFSVAAVRGELLRLAKGDAHKELQKSDWYVTRKVEQDIDIPAEVLELRQKIRDHTDWIADDIEQRTARELVDYVYNFPTSNDQIMVDGIPVMFNVTAPVPVASPSGTSKTLPDPEPPAEDVVLPPEQLDGSAKGREAQEHFAPLVAPEPPPEPQRPTPPPTTDGEVPLYLAEEASQERPNIDLNGIPLVTSLAPTVEDVNGTQDNDQEQQ
jgi:hypothetical protein